MPASPSGATPWDSSDTWTCVGARELTSSTSAPDSPLARSAGACSASSIGATTSSAGVPPAAVPPIESETGHTPGSSVSGTTASIRPSSRKTGDCRSAGPALAEIESDVTVFAPRSDRTDTRKPAPLSATLARTPATTGDGATASSTNPPSGVWRSQTQPPNASAQTTAARMLVENFTSHQR